jgi:short-subunit dehydrogenase
MRIQGSTVLVTGANRGLGRHLAEQALARGAAKVYATARRPELIDIADVEPLRLDVTDPATIAAASEVASDVTVLVNSAGMGKYGSLLTGDLDDITEHLTVNSLGPLRMTRAFAPVLAANGGGAVVNVLSAMSWFTAPDAGGYCASKAAMWSFTNGLRMELEAQQTLVAAVHVGAVDTDLVADSPLPKLNPADVAAAVYAGLERDEVEILVDDWSRTVKRSLAGDPRDFYRQLTAR